MTPQNIVCWSGAYLDDICASVTNVHCHTRHLASSIKTSYTGIEHIAAFDIEGLEQELRQPLPAAAGCAWHIFCAQHIPFVAFRPAELLVEDVL